VVVASLAVAYLSVYISPDKFWIPAMFGLAYPFLLLANFVFIFFWLPVKPKNMLLSLVFILLGWNYLDSYFQIKGKKTEQYDIKVLSYNVRHFVGEKNSDRKENAEDIVSFLQEQKADIICLQEARIRKNDIFNMAKTVEQLESINHYQFARSSTTFGSVTMTRYPIVNMGEIRFDETRNIAIYTDVLIKGDTVRIFNLHLQSYHIDPEKYAILESPGISEEQDIKEMQEIGAKFKTAFQMRSKQVREIRKYIDESPYPIIVCGDFNDTPVSYSYRMIGENLTDAFARSGHGIGRTYIGKVPSFRIDYIMHSSYFDSYNFDTYNYRKSDHLPVTCELVIKE